VYGDRERCELPSRTLTWGGGRAYARCLLPKVEKLVSLSAITNNAESFVKRGPALGGRDYLENKKQRSIKKVEEMGTVSQHAFLPQKVKTLRRRRKRRSSKKNLVGHSA